MSMRPYARSSLACLILLLPTSRLTSAADDQGPIARRQAIEQGTARWKRLRDAGSPHSDLPVTAFEHASVPLMDASRLLQARAFDGGGGPVIGTEKPLDVHVIDHSAIGGHPFPPAADLVARICVSQATTRLSADQRSLYSEFRATVQEILRGDAGDSIDGAPQITMLRRGGAVRLPSGATVRHRVNNRSMPRSGECYLAFLDYRDDLHIYDLLTAYWLRDNTVEPLDAEEQYFRFAGVAVDALLAELNAIQTAPRPRK
jgi:hypothetical protein